MIDLRSNMHRSTNQNLAGGSGDNRAVVAREPAVRLSRS
jgi:hypothetical protein